MMEHLRHRRNTRNKVLSRQEIELKASRRMSRPRLLSVAATRLIVGVS